MNVEEYFEEFKKLVEDNPQLAKAELVTSIDDEGNGFNRVFYGPSLGVYTDGEWEDSEEIQVRKPTHICLN